MSRFWFLFQIKTTKDVVTNGLTRSGKVKIVSRAADETSVTRLGDILKFMPANFLTIVDQIFGTFWANLETINVYVKTELASIWSTFDSFGLLFSLTSGHTVLEL